MFRPRVQYLKHLGTRFAHSSSTPQSRHGLLTTRNFARLTVFTTSSVLLASGWVVYADSDEPSSTPLGAVAPSLGSLLRTYAVYSMCSVPGLVDASPRILSALTKVPVLKQLTESVVRVTFFDQFVGADTAEDAIPLLKSLREENKGVLFAYSVEVDEGEAIKKSGNPANGSTRSGDARDSAPASPFKRIVDETIHCIDVSADFEASIGHRDDAAVKGVTVNQMGRRTWVAIKLTAMLPDAHALIALSSHIVQSRKASPDPTYIPFPGAARTSDLDVILSRSEPAIDTPSLTQKDVHQLRELYSDLVRICTRAKEKGVKVIIDAEYSWYQPAIDALTLGLMRQFNTSGSVQPLVYGTFQAYLRRTPGHLAAAMEDARKNNYCLGVKLVRGAYHPFEIASHRAALEFDARQDASGARPSLSISPDALPPVWERKQDTDDAYNMCARMLVRAAKADIDASRQEARALLPAASASEKGWFGRLTTMAFGGVAIHNPSPRPNVPRIGVLFGTHNWESCRRILDELVESGLGREVTRPRSDSTAIQISDDAVEKLAIGQLYGMCDELSDWIVNRTMSSAPFVIKYVPYGALSDVMPYLSRRAIENKSVLGDGAAARERKRAAREIRRKLFGSGTVH